MDPAVCGGASATARLFGICGFSGAGKTTLIEKLLPLFGARGLCVSVIKHTHHDFDIDQPGKDSYRHRRAGASEVLLAAGKRWALLHELRAEPAPSLLQLVSRLAPCDLILVEGFKREAIPKLEVYRPANCQPALWATDENIIAVASDQACPRAFSPPPKWLRLGDTEEIARFILAAVALRDGAQQTGGG